MRSAVCLVLASLLLAGCVLSAGPDPSKTHDGVIYLETFCGSSDEFLSDKQSDQGRATWISLVTHTVPSWRADGTIAKPTSNQNRNAFLPFVPKKDWIYTLSLEVNPTAGGDVAEFFALGFGASNSVDVIFASRDKVMAGPWWAQAWDRSLPGNTFAGLGTVGQGNHTAATGWVKLEIVLKHHQRGLAGGVVL